MSRHKNSKDDYVRTLSKVESLLARGDDEAYKELFRLMDYPDLAVIRAAARSLINGWGLEGLTDVIGFASRADDQVGGSIWWEITEARALRGYDPWAALDHRSPMAKENDRSQMSAYVRSMEAIDAG